MIILNSRRNRSISKMLQLKKRAISCLKSSPTEAAEGTEAFLKIRLFKKKNQEEIIDFPSVPSVPSANTNFMPRIKQFLTEAFSLSFCYPSVKFEGSSDIG